jgi:hypothetical protein
MPAGCGSSSLPWQGIVGLAPAAMDHTHGYFDQLVAGGKVANYLDRPLFRMNIQSP